MKKHFDIIIEQEVKSMKLNEFVRRLFHKNNEFQLVEINGEVVIGAKINVYQLQENVNALAIDLHNLVENDKVKEYDSHYESDITIQDLNKIEKQKTLDEFDLK